MPKRKTIRKGGLKTYQKIVKAFTKVNNALPENQKLSIKIRRKIISDTLYPQYKNRAPSRISMAELYRRIEGIVELIPPKELCDVSLISPELIAIVDWFAIDEFIEGVIPDCIYVRVDAAEYGKTHIFNTRNYSYYKKSVRQIIDNLRELAKNISQLDFSGYKKVRPGRKDDGAPDSYFIDFILNINGTPVSDTSGTINVELTKRQQKKQDKLRDQLLEKMAELKSTRRKRRSVQKTEQNLEAVKKAKKKVTTLKKAESKHKAKVNELKVFNKAMKQIEKDFANGVLTKKEMIAAKKKLYKNFKQGGQV